MADFDFTGIKNILVGDDSKAYQLNLNARTAEILGENQNISLEDLKKNSIFKQYYDQMDNSAKIMLEKIASMEDISPNNVTERELKTILTIMDADLQGDRFHFDGVPTIGSSGGLNQVTDKEREAIYSYTKTRAQQKEELRAKFQAKIQAEQIDRVKRSETVKAKIKESFNENSFVDSEGNVIAENVAKCLGMISMIEDVQERNTEKLRMFKKNLAAPISSMRDNAGTSYIYNFTDGTEIVEKGGAFNSNSGSYIVTKGDKTVALNSQGEDLSIISSGNKIINLQDLSAELGEIESEEEIESKLKSSFGSEIAEFKHIKRIKTDFQTAQNYIAIELNDGTSITYQLLKSAQKYKYLDVSYPNSRSGIILDSNGRIMK